MAAPYLFSTNNAMNLRTEWGYFKEELAIQRMYWGWFTALRLSLSNWNYHRVTKNCIRCDFINKNHRDYVICDSCQDKQGWN